MLAKNCYNEGIKRFYVTYRFASSNPEQSPGNPAFMDSSPTITQPGSFTIYPSM